jgi:hypothetical protein
MSDSYIKKIISVPEWEKVGADIIETYKQDNENYGHACGLKHDYDLIVKCLSHEAILIWNIHVWAHFNGEKWDSIFIGIIRKSEKFGKKMMEEYLWLSKDSCVGMKLYKLATEYAKSQSCEYLSFNVTENHPMTHKVCLLYTSPSPRDV